ncbi:MAG: lysophospholipid acyltransferase family protein [Leptospiraceae bacterium]|nr:lysophospholipid acyltransferase family protein [Leptospiraceae bacterium]
MKFIIVSYIVKFILSFWFLFIRRQNYYIPEATEKYLNNKSGFIFAGWHGLILSLTRHVANYLQRDRHILLTPLVSLSKDGEFIYQTFLRFKMQSVRGSSSKGGSTALRQILKAIKEGRVPIFTPDGPRGPLHKVQTGIIQMASLTKLPIITFYSRFDRYYEFKSWDKQRFPKFLAKEWVDYSEPFFVPEKIENYEEYAVELEKRMLEQVERLDKIVEEALASR